VAPAVRAAVELERSVAVAAHTTFSQRSTVAVWAMGHFGLNHTGWIILRIAEQKQAGNQRR
jgi:hypothetical protein